MEDRRLQKKMKRKKNEDAGIPLIQDSYEIPLMHRIAAMKKLYK